MTHVNKMLVKGAIAVLLVGAAIGAAIGWLL